MYAHSLHVCIYMSYCVDVCVYIYICILVYTYVYWKSSNNWHSAKSMKLGDAGRDSAGRSDIKIIEMVMSHMAILMVLTIQ